MCVRELDKIMSLDVDGIMYDEFVYLPACFSDEHGHRPGESSWNGGMQMCKDYYEHAWKKQEFLLCGEGVNDQMSQYYPVSYIRSATPGFIPVLGYINQDIRFATCLVGFDNRGMVNQCLAYRFIINYEPFNFKGWVSDTKATGEYALKALALRKKLADYLWTGKYTDSVGATCTCDNPDAKHMSTFKYTVFENSKNGKKAVVVVNDTPDKEFTFNVTIDGGSGKYTVYNADDGKLGTTTGEVTIKPSNLAILVDE